jgi:hypothetical protein
MMGIRHKGLPRSQLRVETNHELLVLSGAYDRVGHLGGPLERPGEARNVPAAPAAPQPFRVEPRHYAGQGEARGAQSADALEHRALGCVLHQPAAVEPEA